jgi:YVTN family beta-propeller protein
LSESDRRDHKPEAGSDPDRDGRVRPLLRPTNDRVYCANWNGTNVTVIDGATNTVVATVPSGRAPLTPSYNSTDNKAYCASHNDAT